jgi:hypothetical protein
MGSWIGSVGTTKHVECAALRQKYRENNLCGTTAHAGALWMPVDGKEDSYRPNAHMENQNISVSRVEPHRRICWERSSADKTDLPRS